MDAKARQVMVSHVGDRSRKRAKWLWAKSPLVYRTVTILQLIGAAEAEDVRLSITAFFRTLAADQQAKPIGNVLSGMDTDGSRCYCARTTV